MADIFISYASEDRSRIEPLAKALEEQGWSIFWARTIPAGKTWREVIGEALETARSVIVAWSNNSVDSRWVQEEADRGLERNILIPILIDNVRPPLGFGTIQAADLICWEPTQSSPQFEKLISDLSSILGPSPLKVKETEQKQAKEVHRRKQEDERQLRKEEQRRTEEGRQRKEEEQKRIEAARKAEEKQERREETEAIKTDKPEAVKIEPSEPHKTGNALKFGVVAGLIVLLIAGLWLYYNKQEEKTISIRKSDLKSWESKGGSWNFIDRQVFGIGASGFNKAFCTDKNLSDFLYEVRLRKVSKNDGPIGLLMRYDDIRDEGYMLLIWPHGDYQLSKLVDQKRYQIISGTPKALNRGNQWNTIKIIGQSTQFQLFINGVKQEVNIFDDKYSFGKFGLVIHGDVDQKAEFKVLNLSSL